MNKIAFNAALILSFSVFQVHPVFAQAPEAQKAVETFINTLRSLEFPVQDEALQSKKIGEANTYLDLESMSRKALGENWNGASKEQQASFLDLMGQLIENVAYPKSHRFMGAYQIAYPEVKESGSGYQVRSVIQHEEEGLNADVLYHVYLRDARWKIDDVILDGVSITEDLQYQFDKIIEKSRFAGLLETMQKRLDDEKSKKTAAA